MLENIFSYIAAARNRYEYSHEDSIARRHHFLIIYRIRQRNTSFKHELKQSFTTTDRGSTGRKTRGQRRNTWKRFHPTEWNQTGDPRSVQTGGAVVEIRDEAG